MGIQHLPKQYLRYKIKKLLLFNNFKCRLLKTEARFEVGIAAFSFVNAGCVSIKDWGAAGWSVWHPEQRTKITFPNFTSSIKESIHAKFHPFLLRAGNKPIYTPKQIFFTSRTEVVCKMYWAVNKLKMILTGGSVRLSVLHATYYTTLTPIKWKSKWLIVIVFSGIKMSVL